MSAAASLPLSAEHAARLESALRSSSIEDLAALLWKLRRRWLAGKAPAALLEQGRELDLIERESGAPPGLTPLGAKVSDSLTEFIFWRQRGRSHHAAEAVDALRVERLRGKRILEVGCGAGVNLLSLQGFADVVGVDVEPLYLQFSGILARSENLPSPKVVCAPAETLPFEDAFFDVVLFPGSLPYMRIELALRETARVLKPGGRAIAVHSDLAQMFKLRVRQRGWKLLAPGTLLREARTFAGMAAYPWAGRVLVEPAAPIHVTHRRTQRWLDGAGLRLNALETRRVSEEMCYVADKPERPSAS
ncbi:MAG TPA: class I SAM-dependent methyltransferase [Planctomycetota bacterium]|nr:class I SAM-dependent methyltransferase [Planctomycetota bacterium]